MKKFLGTMTVLAIGLSASVAMAGFYISGPLPSEFSGGSVPSNPDLMKAMGKGQKEGSKLAAGLAKCYSKGAANFSKNKATGVDACIHNTKKGVVTKYLAKAGSLTPTAPCALDVNASAGLVGSLVKSFNPLIYCQSPSGAFIDQAAF